MSTPGLISAFTLLKQQLETRQQARRVERIEKGKAERNLSHTKEHLAVTLSADVQALFGAVIQSLARDKHRFAPVHNSPSTSAFITGTEDSAPAQTEVPASDDPTGPSAAAQAQIAPEEPAAAAPPPPAASSPSPAASPTSSTPITPYQATPASAASPNAAGTPLPPAEAATAAAAAPSPTTAEAATQTLHLKPLFESWMKVETLLPVAGADHLSPPAHACYAFMNHELTQLTEEVGQHGVAVSPVLMSKLKQAVAAFHAERVNDTVTLLKNILHGDPHNHTVLAILSQALYYLAANGQPTMLPEAREFAHRSIIYSDKISPHKLAIYRYVAMVTELGFGPERVIEWLRETGMLDPHALMTPDGLFAERGIILRCWAMLSHVPFGLWTEEELSSLRELVTHVIGGAAIYAVWFRSSLLEASAMSKTPLSDVEELERLLSTAFMFYAESAAGLKQMPLQTSSMPWFLRVRYLNTVAQLIPLPSFDQVLCMVALDGQNCKEDVFPDRELCTLLEDSSLGYWRLWCMVMTPFKDVRQPYLMPAEETVHDAPLLSTCDNVLAALREAEKQMIKAALWEDIKPWMIRWQIDHLLAASTGSSRPRSRFMPNLVPYTHFYRRWQDPQPSGILPSEVITENAQRGAFSSLFEIVATFEGAIRLINDPVHGLVATQKHALELASKQNPKKYATLSNEFGPSPGSGMMAMTMPLASLGIVAAIIQFSANWSQALGLLLAFAGLAGVVAINLTKR